ncbi:MAG: hypothetical protein JRI94_06280 [Deltaproteobacteria bacterium]|nr:hypothetical protein [Deltaproteobacteria bacterium]
MAAQAKSKHIACSSLFLELYHKKKTGVVTLKNERFTINIYLDKGILVHVDGIDRETRLIQEIAKRKELDPNQLIELEQIKEKDPHSLGQRLIDLGLMSQSGWDKFLVFRARYHLATALMMDGVDLEFAETPTPVPPQSPVNRNFIELLVDTIRDIRNKEFFKKFVAGHQARFQKTEKGQNLGDWVTLTSNEQVALSVIDGQKTVGDISTSTGLSLEDLYQAFYLLSFLSLIVAVQEKGEEKGGGDYSEFIKLYVDFLKITDTYFRKEVGDQFETVFSQCLKELIGKGDKFFREIDSPDEPYEKTVNEISDRFSSLLTSGESPLVIFTSLNKLIYLLIMRMKKILGTGITEKALNEMLKMVSYVEKYSHDPDMMDYIKGNMEDYARQIGS